MGSWFSRLRLWQRMTLYILPIIVIPAIVFTAFLVTQWGNDIEQGLRNLEVVQITAEEDRIEQFLSTPLSDLRIVRGGINIQNLARSLISGDAGSVEIASEFVAQDFLSLVNQNVTSLAGDAVPLYESARFLNVSGQELVRVDRQYAPDTNAINRRDFSSAAGTEYFQAASGLPAGEIFVTDVYLARNDAGVLRFSPDDVFIPMITYSTPIYIDGELAGVIALNLYARNLTNLIVAPDGDAIRFLINEQGYYLFNSQDNVRIFGFEPGMAEMVGAPIEDILGEGGFFTTQEAQTILNFDGDGVGDFTTASDFVMHYVRVQPPGADYTWLLVNGIDRSAFFSTVNNATVVGMISIAIVVVIGVVLTVIVAQQITNPIRDLQIRAQQMTGGDLSIAADAPTLKRTDELGDLSRAFSNMASQLQDVFRSMEDRIKARTNDLEASAEIAGAANQVREVDDLLSLTVNLIRDRFNFYYTQVYLVDPAGEFAVLKDGTGFVGRKLIQRGHKLPLDGRSLVAQAIRENQATVVQDAVNDPNWLPNDLLPETRSEVTIPLRSQDKVIGVLDIQHSVINAFEPETVRLLQSMADQLAVTFDNVSLFQETQRRAVELETVAQVSAEASANLDMTELLFNVSDLVKERFGLYHAHIYLIDEDSPSLVLRGGAGEAGQTMVAEQRRIALDAEQSLVARAARQRQAIIVNDVLSEAYFLPNPLLPETRSEMAVPLVVGNEVVGVLDVQSDELNHFTEEDMRVQTTLAGQLAVAVQNARAYTQVQEALKSVDDLQSAIDESAIVAITDQTGKIIYVNDLFCEVSQYTREELIGQDHRIINSGYHSKEFIRDLWVTIANGQTWKGEIYNKKKDGSFYWVDTTIVPFLNAQGKPRQYIAIRYEITERKRAEEAIIKEAERAEAARRQAEVLYRISQAAIASDTPQEITESVAEASGMNAYATVVALFENYDLAGASYFETAAIATKSDPASLVQQIGDRFPIEFFPQAQTLYERPILMVSDVDELAKEDPTTAESIKGLGYMAYLSITLMIGGRVMGTVNYFYDRPRKFDADDIRVAENAGDVLSAAIERYRLQASTERRADELEAVALVSAEASSNLDLTELLFNASELVKARFGLYHAHIYLLEDDNKLLILRGGAGTAGQKMVADRRTISIESRRSLVARAAREHIPIVVNDVQAEEGFLPHPLLPETRSELAVPLIVRGQVVGVLDVQSNEVNRFNEEDIEIQQTLANQIAVAVRNAQSFEETQRRLRDLRVINAITEIGRTAPDTVTVAEESITVLLEAFGADTAVYSTYNPKDGLWHGYTGGGEGITRELAQSFSDPLNRYPHAVEVMQTGDVVAVENTRTYPDFPEDYIDMLGIKSVLTIPIFTGETVNGVIFFNYVQAHQHFDQEFLNLARSLAIQLSLMIEAKESERAVLQQSALVSASQDYIGIASLEGVTEFINPAGARMVGYDDANELVGWHVSDFYPEVWLAKINEHIFPQLLQEGAWRGEAEFKHKDGSVFPVEQTIFLLRDAEGNPINIATVTADISERKAAEATLRQQSAIVESSSTLIGIASPDGVIQFTNPAGLGMTGYKSEELLGKPIGIFYPDEIMEYVSREGLPQVMETGSWTGEVTFVRKDGSTFDVEQTIFSVKDAQGNIVSIATIVTDISERKAAEVTLRQQSAIVESSTEFIGVASADGMIQFVNPAGLKMTGYDSLDELMGKPIAVFYTPEEAEEVFNVGLPQAIETGRWVKELTYVRKDGSTLPVEQTIFVVKDEQGNVVNAATITVDISERKAAEARLQQSEELYRSTVSNVPGVIYRCLLDENWTMLYISDYVEQLTGYPAEDFIGNRKLSFGDLNHPEDNERASEIVTEAIAEGRTWEVEYRLRHADGSYRWVSEIGQVIEDEFGEKLLTGSINDISERKAAEEERNRLYNTAVDLLGTAGLSDGYFKDLNPAWETTLGWTREELTSRPYVEFVHPDDVERTNREAAEQLGAGFTTVSFENRYRTKDGDWRVLSWNSYPDLENDMISFTARDVTELKRQQAFIEGARHRAEMMAGINARLSAANTEAEILAALHPIVAEQGFQSANLFYTEQAAPGQTPNIVEVVSVMDTEGNMLPPSVYPQTRLMPEEFPILSETFKNPFEPFVSGDLMNDPRIQHPTSIAFLEATGIRASLMLPLVRGNEWYGLISMVWNEPKEIPEEIVQIVKDTLTAITSVVSTRRAYLNTEQARIESETLYRISEAVNLADTPQDITDAVARESGFDTYSTVVAVFENYDLRNARYFETAAITTDDPDKLVQKVGDRFSIDMFPQAQTLYDRPVMVVEDIDDLAKEDPQTAESLRMLGYAAYISVTLAIGNRVMGTMNFFFDKPHRFTESQKRIAQSAADLLSAGLERYRLQASTERRASELAIVTEVSTATTTLLNIEQLLEAVANLTKERYNLYHAHIYLVQGERLVLAGGAGEPGRQMKARGHNIPLSQQQSLVVRAATERTGVISNNVTSDTNFFPNPMLPETKSEMAVPMIVGGEVIGVLDVQSNQVDRFDQQDVQVKTVLAAQVAVAVQNAKLFEEVQTQAEREREVAERLREVDRLKSQFLANMSHELRTPLNSIIGYSEVLLDGVDGELTEDAEEDVEAIHNSGKHLLSIINEILDLAKIEAGEMHLDLKPIDLAEFVAEIVRTGQVLVKDKPVVLEAVQEMEIPPVGADAVRLRQILWNLVSNAIKFTEEGSVRVHLNLKDRNNALVTIRDTGIGMDEEQLSVIFERFSQVDGSSTRRAGGTGLGLTITKQLIEMHGGSIEVESIPDVGSTFWFTIPLYVEEGQGEKA